MAKLDARTLLIGGGILLVILMVLVPMLLKKKSKYDVEYSSAGNMFNQIGSETQVDTSGVGTDRVNPDIDTGAAPVTGGSATSTGVSTSMLPKEIPSQEDFGNFSPDVIMAGQNYLDPRSQIGYPETLGGVLRNANYDIRSEPPNPRVPVSIFNNSTIVPDMMRPQFEIGR